MAYISYCGLLCNECPIYTATINKDEAAKERLAAEYSNDSTAFTASDMNCEGCFAAGTDGSKMCGDCDVRNCARGKELSCGRCPDYPCQIIEKRVPAGSDHRERLERVREAVSLETENIANGRAMLKPDWDSWDSDHTHQKLGAPIPDRYGKPQGEIIKLPDFNALKEKSLSLIACLENRRSKRKYTDEPLTMEELSYLVWAGGGISGTRNGINFRTYASGGNTQALNAYIFVNNVEGLESGIYRYFPAEHALAPLNIGFSVKEQIESTVVRSCFNAQVVFIWSVVPYRTEWRYTTVSHKMIAMEAGHACQNLYLAAESLSMGCVAIAAYSQSGADALLGLDGEEEFVAYLAAAGK